MADAKWPAWLEQWVIPHVREPARRPVLLALIGHVVIVLVPVVLAVARGPEGWAVATLAASVALTVWALGIELRALGRPAAVAATLAVTWLAAVGTAWFAAAAGIL